MTSNAYCNVASVAVLSNTYTSTSSINILTIANTTGQFVSGTKVFGPAGASQPYANVISTNLYLDT